MKEYDSNRTERFQNEKSLLKPLPVQAYQISEWKTAKVHADCHIQFELRFYSVPFQYVGRTVRLRITDRLLEVFDEERAAIATHVRLSGKDRVSTQG